MTDRIVHLPLSRPDALSLRAGESVRLCGTMYTGRDAAHKRLCGLVEKGEPLPFDPRGQVIYYVGPTPARPGQVIGSAGPTTSYRMDPYTPAMLEAGLLGMVGKGIRCPEVIAAMRRFGAVYFGATGGAAALIAKCIRACELVAYPELGTEAVYRLKVEDFPAVVLIDAQGENLYETGPKQYCRSGG